MGNSESGVISVAQSHDATVAKREGEYLVLQCLVVSVSSERRELFARAAAEVGWDTALVADATAAIAHQRRKFMQLAFVDLESDASGSLHELLEQLASLKGLLTIACGTAGDMEEEIWVRQVGAWLYLPGVDEQTQLSVLCDEARRIVERLHVSATRSTGSKPGEYRKAR